MTVTVNLPEAKRPAPAHNRLRCQGQKARLDHLVLDLPSFDALHQVGRQADAQAHRAGVDAAQVHLGQQPQPALKPIFSRQHFRRRGGASPGWT